MSAPSNNITIIIPTFNRKKLVAQTIHNILNQTLVPSEIIVVDDHSSDGTIEHLKKQFDKRIILILNEGKGPGAARNTGFAISSGQFIKFFDSDDLMTINTVESQYRVLKDSKKSFVYSPYFFAKQDENKSWKIEDAVIMSYYDGIGKSGLRNQMCKGLFICIPSMMFKRELLEKVGVWPNDIVAYEDWEFLWRISSFENFPAHHKECAFLYRLHNLQTTQKNYDDRNRDLQKLRSFKRIFNSDLNYFKSAPMLNRLYFMALMYETWILYKGDKEFEAYKFLDRLDLKLISFFKRLEFKVGRIKTGTKWQPMHGVLKSFDIVNSYFKKVNYGI